MQCLCVKLTWQLGDLVFIQVLEISAPLVVLDTGSTSLGCPAAPAGGAATAAEGQVNLCLLDTPGPNEAGEEGLKYQVRGAPAGSWGVLQGESR